MVEAIAHFLVQEWLAYALIGIIVVASAYFIVRFWRELRSVQEELRAAREIIEAVPDASAFFADFDRLSEALRQLPIMGHAWKEFEESLVVPGEREDATTVLNSKEPAAHFHLDLLLTGRVATRFYEAFPNLLVGFGILWTFLGLAGGIHLAVPGLSSDNVAQLKGGLRDLLGGAFLAFAKSGVAIGCSLLFTALERKWMGATDKLLEDFCAALDKRLTLETPEKLAGLQLEELRKQTMELNEPAPILWTPLMSRNTRGCVHGTQEEKEFHARVQGRGSPVGQRGDEVAAPGGQGPGSDRVGLEALGKAGRRG